MLALNDVNYFRKVALSLLFIFIIGAIIFYFLNTLDFISYTYMMVYFFSFSLGGFFGMHTLFSKKTPYNTLWRGILLLSLAMFLLSLSAQDFSLLQVGNISSSLNTQITLALMIISGSLLILGSIDTLSIYAFRFTYKIIIEIGITFFAIYMLMKSLLPDLFSYQQYYFYANIFLLTLIYLIFRISHSKSCSGIYILNTGLFFMFIGNSIIAFKTNNVSHFIGDSGDFFIILSGLTISMAIYEIGKTFTQKPLQ